jgi:hypothetical protein
MGVTYLRGKRGGKLLWPSRYEAWSVLCVLYPLEACSIVADPESLAVTPYQRVLCNGLVVCLLVISPKEVCVAEPT